MRTSRAAGNRCQAAIRRFGTCPRVGLLRLFIGGALAVPLLTLAAWLLASTAETALAQCDDAVPGLLSATKTTIGTALAIDVQGNYAYVGDWGGRVHGLSSGGILHIFDVTDPCAPRRLSRVAADTPSDNELGDLVVHDSGAGAWAYLANDNNGLTIYDVSDPARPQYLSSRPAFSYALYLFYAGGRYAYVGQTYASGKELAIYDLTAPETASPTFYGPTFGNHRDIHDVQIADGRAYVVAIDGYGDNHFQILDLTIPDRPTLLGDLALPRHQYGEVGDLRVQGSYVYMVISNVDSDPSTFVTIDVSDAAHPQLVKRIAFPNEAIPWPIGNVPWFGASLDLANNQIYIVTERGLVLFDLADPADPQLEAVHFAFPPEFGPCLGGRVVVKDGLAYVTVYGDVFDDTSHGGLAIYRLPAQPAAHVPPELVAAQVALATPTAAQPASLTQVGSDGAPARAVLTVLLGALALAAFIVRCSMVATRRHKGATAPPQSAARCPSCGAELPAQARYCIICGADLSQTGYTGVTVQLTPLNAPALKCPSCGAGNPAGARYCQACQMRLPDIPVK